MPDPDKLDPKSLLDWLCLKPGQVEEWWRDRGRHYRDQHDLLRRECCRDWLDSCQAGINEPSQDQQIRCVYQPTLADLCWEAFDCVVVDEGVKMKGGDTLIGQGVRKLCPPHRLVLTATPVKNRVPDLFWLAWWAAGGKTEPHAGGPFAGEAREQTHFAETFLVAERNLTNEKKDDSKRRYQK